MIEMKELLGRPMRLAGSGRTESAHSSIRTVANKRGLVDSASRANRAQLVSLSLFEANRRDKFNPHLHRANKLPQQFILFLRTFLRLPIGPRWDASKVQVPISGVKVPEKKKRVPFCELISETLIL